jgi:hypothetical protein
MASKVNRQTLSGEALLAERFRGLLAGISGRASPRHGYPLRAVETAETRLGLSLPGPLRAYYLSVGRHKINRAHNRLLPPDALETSQGRLVFMAENQCVVFWGVRSRTVAADPVVFQTADLEDGDWCAETPCSQFLAGMMCWQAVSGGLSHIGYSDRLKLATTRQLIRGWPSAGRMGGLSAFVRDGWVLCILNEGASALAQVGARSRRGFEALVSELGVAVHEA